MDINPKQLFKVGDIAPDFKVTIQTGEIIQFHNIQSEHIVLFFYPADNTPTCTKEVCHLRDNFKLLQSQGYYLLGLSPDSVKKHNSFIDKFNLPFDLGVDENHEVASLYGLWGEKKMMGVNYDGIHRTTYVIGSDKCFEKIIYPVDSGNQIKQILE